MLRLITPLVAAAFCLAQIALAAAPSSTSNPEEELAAAKRLADGLKYRQGEITLKDGLAKIKLPETFLFWTTRIRRRC